MPYVRIDTPPGLARAILFYHETWVGMGWIMLPAFLFSEGSQYPEQEVSVSH